MSNTNLPKNWLFTTLGKVVDYGKTVQVEPEQIDPSTWVLELEDLEKDTSRLLNRKTFAERNSKSSKNLFEKGDILYGKLRPYLNKVIIADQPGCCTTEIIPIKVPKTLNNRYLFYWLKSPTFLHYVAGQSHGLNMPRLGTAAAKAAPFVLAPISVQSMVADRLDHLLARVDSCRAHLDRAAAAIKRFRQSVLNAAVTGALNQSNFDKWQLFSLEQIGTLARGKSKHRPRNEPKLYGGPYPFIQTGDIANSGGRITSHKQTYSEEGLKQSKLFPAGTLCITIAANIADTAILTYPACFPDSVVGFIADNKVALNRFIQFAIDANKTLLDELATATAQKNINLSTFQKFKFRAPLVEEQVEIVMKAETLLNKADEIESKLTAARERVDNLTASILAKAFRGELL